MAFSPMYPHLNQVCEKPDLDLVARNLGISLPIERLMFRPHWYRTSEVSLRHSLKIALTHSSYLNENPNENLECNERLEFLGDALLGLVIANELYAKYTDLQEGALTQIRANVVNTETLARVARNLRLGEHILFGSGEEKTGGANRNSNLANAFEAVVAAIGISSSNNGYNEARDFCLRVLREEIDRAYHEVTSAPKQAAKSDSAKKQNQSSKSKTPNTAGKHPKSALQEIVQAKYGVTPEYRSDKPKGKSHQPTFTTRVYVKGKVMGTGKGNGKKAAETEAAQAALKALQNTR